MIKLAAAALLLLVVACHGFLGNLGGYVDRPELINDQTTQALANYAAEHIATTQNLLLEHIKVIRVQTQLVNGVNYKINFTAEPVEGISGQTTTCEVVINVRFDSVKNIAQAQCQTS